MLQPEKITTYHIRNWCYTTIDLHVHVYNRNVSRYIIADILFGVKFHCPLLMIFKFSLWSFSTTIIQMWHEK